MSTAPSTSLRRLDENQLSAAAPWEWYGQIWLERALQSQSEVHAILDASMARELKRSRFRWRGYSYPFDSAVVRAHELL